MAEETHKGAESDFGARKDGTASVSNWLEEKSILELQQMMESGERTSQDLVYGYMERIAEYDHEGPALKSVIELNPDAPHIAAALDEERHRRGPRGPLHGIPVLIKDNIDTADKMHTSAGTLALHNSYAARDAYLVHRLRRAGAVILGKTNPTELANFMTFDMPNGYSSRGGQTLNPYGPGTFDVGGSSAGSGAAPAANLCAVAVGTETSGSILHPSSHNGIVGIKPTVGLISRSGIIPISYSQDTAGPMARTVFDAAILLWAMAGHDAHDPATLSSPIRHRRHGDFSTAEVGAIAMGANAPGRGLDLRGVRLGVPLEGYLDRTGDEERRITEAGLQVLRDLGATVVEGVKLPTFEHEWVSRVMIYEFKAALNSYLKGVGPEVAVHSLADLIAYNEAHADVALRYGQKILEESEGTSGSLTEAVYIRERLEDLRVSQREGIDAALAADNLDAIVFPAYYGAEISAKAGYPSVTVPAGFTSKGLPFGITFTATAFTEPKLIRYATAFEAATHHRRAPKLG